MRNSVWLINVIRYSLCSLFMFAFAACGSVFDGEGDCTPKYRVKLKYDMNIKFADAFSNEVSSISAYLFNGDGKFLSLINHQKVSLDTNSNSFLLNVPPGRYKMVVFGNILDNKSYTLSGIEQGDDISSLCCKMNRVLVKSDLKSVVDKDITPVFHGYVDDIVLPDEEGEHVVVSPLSKNVNVIRVLLQSMSGNRIKAENFSFEIETDNGSFGYDNSLFENDVITYRPWNLSEGSADIERDGNNDIDADIDTDTDTELSGVNVVSAEFTIGRLMADRGAKLTVKNSKDKVVLSIPLVDYILLTKGAYRQNMPDQEYLDRQDEYNIMFFLDSDNNWNRARIIINGWTIVLNDFPLG